MHFAILTPLLLAAVGLVSARYDAGSGKNLAVYWGSNSVGQNNKTEVSYQGPLVEYCKNTEVDVCEAHCQCNHC
jgi:hypothetical protein